jgi:hypothetical protein
MELPASVGPYLAQVADDKLTTLAQLQEQCGAFQRMASVVGARLGLELSELDQAHHDITARVVVGNHAVNAAATGEEKQPLARALGQTRRTATLIENCAQRSRFVQGRLQDLARAMTEVRSGITELENDQAALAAASKAS